MSSWPCGCRCYLGRVGALFGFFFVQKLIVSDKKRKQLTLDSETFVMGAFFYRNSLFL